MSAYRFNRILCDLGIINFKNGNWYIADRYKHEKLIESNGRGDEFRINKWTQQGKTFLYEELKKHDILPVIERNELMEAM